MSEYKLTYFDVRGLGEGIRLLLTLAELPFENEVIPLAKWAEFKPVYEQLPILTEDGKEFRQSAAIARYLGKKYGFYPEDPFLAYRCDQIVDTLEWTPVAWAILGYPGAPDKDRVPELRRNLVEVVFPKYYRKYEKVVGEGSGPYIAGEKISYADLLLFNWLDVWGELLLPSDFLNDYPALKRLKESVLAVPLIKAYIEKRPKYPI